MNNNDGYWMARWVQGAWIVVRYRAAQLGAGTATATGTGTRHKAYFCTVSLYLYFYFD